MIIPLIEREQTPRHIPPPGVDSATLPRAPQLHLFETEQGGHLLVVNGSRLYSISPEVQAALERSLAAGDPAAVDAALVRLGLDTPPAITDEPLVPPPVRALSLAISQKCNLGCSYCYAQEGGFGAAPRQMPLETALAAVELLVSQAAPGERVNLAFLGGEPLANRAALRTATEHALALAAPRRVQVTFSITTNGTLLTPDDGVFFERHGFAVTVSLDGVGAQHDQQRAFKGGQGSYGVTTFF